MKNVLSLFRTFVSKVSKNRHKKRPTQDVVVNFIKTVLSYTVIKIVWSNWVFILSFVSWQECVQLIKSIFRLLYCFSWAVDICLFKTPICRNCYVRFEA